MSFPHESVVYSLSDDPSKLTSYTQSELHDAHLINMDKIPKYNVVHKLQKRGLLIAINALAGLSIFFFGYDREYFPRP